MYNEPELIQRITEGDEVAFAQLFHHYCARLEIHINAIVKKPDIVEDIIQETFIKIWMNRDKLSEIVYIQTWIFTIASNACFNYLRSLFREEKRMLRLEIEEDDSGSTELLMDYNEVRHLVHEAIDLLSPQRKTIWQMHRDQDMKHAEIAGKLGISVQTVKNTMSKSLEFIREYLKKNGHIFMYVPILNLSSEGILRIVEYST